MDRIDNELREQALMQIFYLVSDLLQMDKNIEWVKLNAYERAEAIRDIYKEFKDWISNTRLRKLLKCIW
nr:hypothetical protein [Mycoplasmopsis bovis]